MSTTLFLKYRPQIFSDLVGQEFVVKTLQNALKSEKPAHSYLFVGSRGTGKTSMARIFAKGLNCLNLKNGAPCGECDICLGTANGSLIDVIEIDAASYTGVDNIRDLREKVNFLPNIAKRKIYIIDEVHMLSKGAFNALLKTLEEPPVHAFFILATTEFEKVPETIVSRCQTFTFERFSREQLVERLEFIAQKEAIETTREALDLIARKAEGGLRDAIGLLEQISAETEGKISAEAVRDSLGISSQDQLESFFVAIEEKNIDEAFSVLRDINQRGGDFRSFSHDFLNFLREKVYGSLSENREKLPRFIQQIEAIEHAITRFRTSPLVELPLEIAVLKLCTGEGAVSVTSLTSPKSIVSTPKPGGEPKQETSNSSHLRQGFDEQKQQTTEENEDPKVSSDFVFDNEKKEAVACPKTDMLSSNLASQSHIIKELQSLFETEEFPSYAKKALLQSKPKIDGQKIRFYMNLFYKTQLQNAKIELKLQHALSKRLNIPLEEVSFVLLSEAEEGIEEKNDAPATSTHLKF